MALGPALNRRLFLQSGAGAAVILASPAIVGRAAERRVWASDPFSLGVASGSPSADGFVLWTRLAPEPMNYDPAAPAGLSGPRIALGYEIARDEAMKSVVRHGMAIADPNFAYSVHAEISGLPPGRPYWYRFMSGGAVSAIGRAMTLPAPDATPSRLNFGFVSCANYEHGYYAAYRHLAEENPDLVLFLGDYIYEAPDLRSADLVRKHSEGADADTLARYRNRYAQYKLDTDLKRLHATATALITWDDHEVQNDYANEASQDFAEPGKFLVRRAAAYHAFYEHMPLRLISRPNGANMRVYGRYRFGDLVEFSLLDGRQYRSIEACYARPKKGGAHLETNTDCPERLDPRRSMIGAAQEKWLFDGLAASRAHWNVIAQDVLMAQFKEKNEKQVTAYWTDDWNGYPASRTRLLQHINDSRASNPVVIGGDIHSYWANDLKLDFEDPSSPTVATEFVGTSISSHGPPYDVFASFLPDNPHVRFFESRMRGYVVADVSRDRMTTRLRAISSGTDPNATVSTLKTFMVENGKPGPIAA